MPALEEIESNLGRWQVVADGGFTETIAVITSARVEFASHDERNIHYSLTPVDCFTPSLGERHLSCLCQVFFHG
jgi:hypothetical protein